MAARWRKQPNETGLARVCQRERGFELRGDDGEWIIIVAPNTGRYRETTGWYWYGIDRNTYAEGIIFPTKEEAKADADKAYKEWRKKGGKANAT